MKTKSKQIIKTILTMILCIQMLMTGLLFYAKDSIEITPDWYCGAYSADNNIFAMSNYYGQCTWYAWGRAFEKTGVRLPCTGNAKTWLDSANARGFITTDVPRKDAIAVWGGTYGHVAYVEEITEDGTLILTHSNSGEHTTLDKVYSLEEGITYYAGAFTKTPEEMKNLNGKPLLGYIYLTNDMVDVIAYTSKNVIATNDAQLWGRVFKPMNSAVTKIGIRLWQDGNPDDAIFKTESPSKNYIGSMFMEPYYNVQKELGINLQAGTVYYYQIYAVVDGVEHFSPPVSFKTEGYPHKDHYSLADVLRYARYLVGQTELTYIELFEADYNNDGLITLSDVLGWARVVCEG